MRLNKRTWWSLLVVFIFSFLVVPGDVFAQKRGGSSKSSSSKSSSSKPSPSTPSSSKPSSSTPKANSTPKTDSAPAPKAANPERGLDKPQTKRVGAATKRKLELVRQSPLRLTRRLMRKPKLKGRLSKLVRLL